jgi:putative oxidoreductase
MFKNRALHCIAKFYMYFVSIGNNLQSLFLLWMRLTWGHQFALTGSGKLAHIDNTIQFFTSLHLAYPTFEAYLVAFIELIGGTLLVVGFCSRIAGVVLVFTMIMALSSPAHVSIFREFQFLFEPSLLVKQTPYPFLITSLLVFIFGPGRVSIDAWIKRWSERQPKY